MRFPESKIKQAILHPEEEMREQALHYFSDARSQDDTVMPLVIQAVEKYGRDTAFSILRDAEHLVQTDATIDWLMGELRRDYNTRKIADDNYRYAVAMVLAEADPKLLAPREAEILALPAFPRPLRTPLCERINMLSWDWDRTWDALMHFGIDTMRRKNVTQNDCRYGERLVEALARHQDQSETVLNLLKRPYRGKDRSLVLWLEPQLVELAGEMQIQAAIPRLMKRAKQGEDVPD